MTIARASQISATDTPYYHCIARCVRRAFLCGEDRVTGRNFEHRRQWIVDKLKQLSAIFAIDVCAYAVMSNHYHVVLRIDLLKSGEWSDRQVVDQWTKLFNAPPLVQRYLSGEAKTASEQRKVAEVVAEWRARLSDISWYMRCLNEGIARQANAEDKCKGRFWEGRFKSQALLDESALLTCMVYVDLNPVRAGLSDTPEDSDYTSIQERIQLTAAALSQRGRPAKPVTDQPPSVTIAPASQGADAGPVTERSADLLAFVGDEHSEHPAVGITYHYGDYLALVESTGRLIRDDKRGAIPAQLAPMLQRLNLDPAHWVQNVDQFGRRFCRVIGPADRLKQLSEQLGQSWLKGLSSSRQMYVSSG